MLLLYQIVKLKEWEAKLKIEERLEELEDDKIINVYSYMTRNLQHYLYFLLSFFCLLLLLMTLKDLRLIYVVDIC